MLDVTRPWLPLLDDAPRTDTPARKPRRRALSAMSATSSRPEDRAVSQAFLGIVSSWALSATEALRPLEAPQSREAERPERLQGVLGAHRSHSVITPERVRHADLLRRPDPALDGPSPLEVMVQQGLSGITRVRAHLWPRLPAGSAFQAGDAPPVPPGIPSPTSTTLDPGRSAASDRFVRPNRDLRMLSDTSVSGFGP